MTARKVLAALAGIAIVLAAGAGLYTRDTWWGRIFPPQATEESDDHGHDHAHGGHERVKLTPQARANLRLVVQPIALTSYARTLSVPGMIVDRPGKSDRGVTTPIAGIVTEVAATPGATVQPGDALVRIRVISETLQTSQTELFKATRELQIAQEQKRRLDAVAGSVPEARILELDYQQRRLATTIQALRYDLAARGLSPEQIQGIAEGKFITEIVIRAPGEDPQATSVVAHSAPSASAATPVVYEVQDLKVQLGDQVQAGQTLCLLARHQKLFVEGAAFAQEVPLLEQAAQQGWPVHIDAAGERGSWPPLSEPLRVQFLGNRTGENSQTIPFYVPLTNQYREHGETGKVHRLWRFRPGQRVRLQVPVQQFANVFVLPLDAVIREGVEAYVFRANGDAFDRKPVHVVFEDRQSVVVANDGSINEGNYIAQNGAIALNRVLKSQSAEEHGHGHGHDHHGHSHEH